MAKRKLSGVTIGHDRRLKNIRFIKNLKKKGLENNKKEARILWHICTNGEKIYIQFPGKESKRTPQRKKINIHDMRPIALDKNGKELPSLTFGEIWNSISLLSKSQIRHLGKMQLELVHMQKNYSLSDLSENKLWFVTIKNGIQRVKKAKVKLKTLFSNKTFTSAFKYHPSITEIRKKFKRTDKICGLSIEGYLVYIELLGWNESTKYALRMGKSWNKKTGGVNTHLTFMNVFLYLLGRVQIGDLLQAMSNGRGVAIVGADGVSHFIV